MTIPLFAFYYAYIIFLPYAALALVLVLDILKAINGTEDNWSVIFHFSLLLVLTFVSILYFYINFLFGFVESVTIMIAYVLFLVCLSAADLTNYHSAKEELVIRLFKPRYDTEHIRPVVQSVAKVIKVALKGDRKVNIAIRYLFVLPILSFVYTSAYLFLAPLLLFLAGSSVRGYLSLLAAILGTILLVKSIVTGHSMPSFIKSIGLSHTLYFEAKVVITSLVVLITLYGLRDKLNKLGLGAPATVLPMLALFFIAKNQEPLGSLAYTLGAITSLILGKREKLEDKFNKFLAKLSKLGNKIIMLEVTSLPYIVLLIVTICPVKIIDPRCISRSVLVSSRENIGRGIRECLACPASLFGN